MRILLIKAMADDHSYSQFVAALARALEELGHEAVVSDQAVHAAGGAAPTQYLVAELQASRFDAVVSFSSFFGGVTLANGVSLFDALGVKFVGWQLDHPIYAPQSLATALKGRWAVYSNPNHLRYAKAVKLPGRGMTLLPGAEAPEGPPKAWASRTWPVLVAATWNGEPQRLWEQLPDSAGRSLLMGVIDRLLADRDASLLDAFNDTCAKLKLGARLGDDPAFDAQMHGFLTEPLTYVRNLDRIAVIRALADAGLPLAICSEGWEGFLGPRPNVTHLGRVPFRDMQSLYADAQVVVNLNAGNGACERALQAAAAGAAVASDHSAALDGLFGGSGAIGVFNRAQPQTAAEVAGGLLDPARGEAVAEAGRARVALAGGWRGRAQELVDFLATG